MAAIAPEEQANYDVFRECLGEAIVQRLTAPEKSKRKRTDKKKGRRNSEYVAGPMVPLTEDAGTTEAVAANDAEELADFIEYIASEVFIYLPPDLRALSHKSYTASPALQDKYSDPLPASTRDNLTVTLSPDVLESLTSYMDPQVLILNVIIAFISNVTTAPPPPSSTRPDNNECEICERDQLPLTYHHLIPRETHMKVLKRGWHAEEDLDNVAWICRACHNFVHKIASNEELAREWYTVELLTGREEVQAFARWVGRVRWKAR